MIQMDSAVGLMNHIFGEKGEMPPFILLDIGNGDGSNMAIVPLTFVSNSHIVKSVYMKMAGVETRKQLPPGSEIDVLYMFSEAWRHDFKKDEEIPEYDSLAEIDGTIEVVMIYAVEIKTGQQAVESFKILRFPDGPELERIDDDVNVDGEPKNSLIDAFLEGFKHG